MKTLIAVAVLTLTTSSFASTCMEFSRTQICADVVELDNQKGVSITNISPAIATVNLSGLGLGGKKKTGEAICDLFLKEIPNKIELKTTRSTRPALSLIGRDAGSTIEKYGPSGVAKQTIVKSVNCLHE